MERCGQTSKGRKKCCRRRSAMQAFFLFAFKLIHQAKKLEQEGTLVRFFRIDGSFSSVLARGSRCMYYYPNGAANVGIYTETVHVLWVVLR